MKKIPYGLLIVTTFILSFLLASYLSQNNLTLPKLFNDVLAIFYSEPDKPIETNPVGAITAITAIKPLQNIHINHNEDFQCVDTSIDDVKFKRVGDVFTWTDSDGINHFSDQPPTTGDFDIYDFAGEKTLDYFTLNLTTTASPLFRNQLEIKIQKLFSLYGQLLDKSSLRKIEINQQIFVSELEFNQHRKKTDSKLSVNTAGFYMPNSNQASILLSTPSKTMRTSVHEAVHAINRGVIGYTPHWLNEGLAEYSEQIDVSMQVGKISPNSSWVSNGRINFKPVPLQYLFTASHSDWNSDKAPQLYATAWAFIHYMMDKPRRKPDLARLIKFEQHKRCDRLTIQQIEKVLGIKVQAIELQFQLWTRGMVKPHTV